ncbi:MAG: hypothetical protein NTW89_06225, partial [Burkholderiales bacterium]|nr:hypothetical protein [Burkholderiales bacterium]
MTIKVGDRVPDATLTEFIEVETAGCTVGPNNFQVADLVKPTNYPRNTNRIGSCDSNDRICASQDFSCSAVSL